MVMIAGTYIQNGLERTVSVNELSSLRFGPDTITSAKSDPGAFTRLYFRHYDAIFKYCVHRLFDRQTAEDVTSEVFLSIVKNFHTFEGNERQFRNWIYRIATNAVNQHLRKSSRQKAILFRIEQQTNEANGDDGGSKSESQEDAFIVKRALLALKPKDQTIITMRFFENLKLEEIAEIVGTSAGTVRSQLSRALAKLRKQFTSARKGGREAAL